MNKQIWRSLGYVWKSQVGRILLSMAVLLSLYVWAFPFRTLHPFFGGDYEGYLHVAVEEDFLANVVHTDAGYLPWLQRSIARVVVYFWGPATPATPNSIYLTSWIALVVVALNASCLNLDLFARWNKSRALRFLAGLVLGTFPSFSSMGFENFTHYMFGLGYALILCNKRAMSRSLWLILLLSTPLVLVNKPAMVAFLPAMMIRLLVSCRANHKEEYRQRIFLLFGSCCLLIQCFSMHLRSFPGTWSSSTWGGGFSFADLVTAVAWTLMDAFRTAVGCFSIIGFHRSVYVNICLGIILLSGGAWAIYRSQLRDAAATAPAPLDRLVNLAILLEPLVIGVMGNYLYWVGARPANGPMVSNTLAQLVMPVFSKYQVFASFGLLLVALASFEGGLKVIATKFPSGGLIRAVRFAIFAWLVTVIVRHVQVAPASYVLPVGKYGAGVCFDSTGCEGDQLK